MRFNINDCKLALLIPTTSHKRINWTDMKDTYLYNFTYKTFLQTRENDIAVTFYIGVDEDDKIWNMTNQEQFSALLRDNYISCKFISMSTIQKGHLTKMWNKLFQCAYDEGNDYFYQCGDDINFQTQHWISESIFALKTNNDIGLSGPKNNNSKILTQGMVSRKHMEIFGYFFPEEIKNTYCDDWYNLVYKPDHLFILYHHYCSNDGGKRRYDIDCNSNCDNKKKRVKIVNKIVSDLHNLVTRDKEKLSLFINNKLL